jgi:hypothetical protein
MSLTKETDAIRGTSTVYGKVETGRAFGVVNTVGPSVDYRFDLTGQQLSDLVILDVVIPANTIIDKVYMQVTEVFVVAGSSVVEVGTDGSEATNGVSITEAQLEALGYTDLTTALAGTWDANAPLAADTTVGIAFSAGSVTTATAGKARIVFECMKIV